MAKYSYSHLADHVLTRELAAALAHDRASTATVLAYLAEVDARRLFAPAGYPSMHAYCMGALHMSEDAAAKRIQAARAARAFPAVFAAVAAGRIHLSGVVLLAPYLAPRTAEDLLVAATHASVAGIRLLLAERFPRPDVPTLLQAAASPGATVEHATQHVGMTTPEHVAPPADAPEPRARVAPLSAERFALQVTLGRDTHHKLRYAQDLLGHAVARGDVAAVLDRALDALVEKLERSRFASTARPRKRRGAGEGRGAAQSRHVPAELRRAVWLRDGGRCAFVSDQGHRCEARANLQFDHVQPVARGGLTTPDNLRLACSTHNQHAADRVFGEGFMNEKRAAAKQRVADGQARRSGATVVVPENVRATAATAIAPATERPLVDAINVAPVNPSAAVPAAVAPTREGPAADGGPAPDHLPPAPTVPSLSDDTTSCLRTLGYRRDEIRHALALCEAIPEASLEQRVRYIVSRFAPGGSRRSVRVACHTAEQR